MKITEWSDAEQIGTGVHCVRGQQFSVRVALSARRNTFLCLDQSASTRLMASRLADRRIPHLTEHWDYEIDTQSWIKQTPI